MFYLQLEVALLLNPVTETAQRVSPILRVIRDQLKLPLHLVLAPPSEIDADSKIPITSYYRLVADPKAIPDQSIPTAVFSYLPSNHILTIRVEVPESWNIQQTVTVQDTDNLLCDIRKECSDKAYERKTVADHIPMYKQDQVTKVEYGLKNLLFFGQCYETKGTPPNGLQLKLVRNANLQLKKMKSNDDVAVIGVDGTTFTHGTHYSGDIPQNHYSDTLVMKNVGYWQLRANPGVWTLSIADDSKGFEIFEMVDGSVKGGAIHESKTTAAPSKTLFLKDFVGGGEVLLVKRRPGFETASLFHSEKKSLNANNTSDGDVINVFSLATGHLYERFLKIMMLSVTKRTSSKVKFWLFENFLSPGFKGSAKAMSERIGCEVEYVTYKWPEWLRGQTEKQRIIWGYKILFLDVLFPLDVKKIIYVDADQVIRGDLKELWNMDLKGAPYGYTPFCTSRESTLGYQFWREGFWKNHLGGKPYHISALYVVDLERFRRTLVGDQLRSTYQQLSADPNSLSNLDQDLPNYAQHQVPIFSLPQEWLWCESWCSDETKSLAKTIDLCNNPEHKEPKVSMAKRIISGSLFNESWVELDAEVEGYEKDYIQAMKESTS
jgi:UDP-glucose:glycoprotein glucosyltransferase